MYRLTKDWREQSELDDSDEDNLMGARPYMNIQGKPKGVEGLIRINNPNRPSQDDTSDSDDDNSDNEDLATKIENSLMQSPTREERDRRDKEKKEKRAEQLRQIRSQQQAPQQESQVDKSNLCIECEDTPGQVRCEQCGEIYCDLCFKSQHRKGNRSQHRFEKIEIAQLSQQNQSQESTKTTDSKSEKTTSSSSSIDLSVDVSPEDYAKYKEALLDRCKFTPIRLNQKERKFLRLVESALNVSEYTDKIDILSYKSKAERITEQLEDICATLLGLVVACDYKMGQTMVNQKSYKDNEEFFQSLFEIARRYKITNPEKMRTDYGKLLYLLQDSVYKEITTRMGFTMVRSIKTVYTVLEAANLLSILDDPTMLLATTEVIENENLSRSDIETLIKRKEVAIDTISKKHAKAEFGQDDIKQVIYSIADNNTFLAYNRDPVDKMIEYLSKYFSPKKIEKPDFSLEINYGRGGARLSHSHDRQYYYVMQSLHLWRGIMHDMFKLWLTAELDLLDEQNYYRLRDTGQGLNRVQDAPRIYKLIAKILSKTQQKVGGWVGSSVIHLGDHNVPNAFMFIDKYTQVPRILAPIVRVIQRLDEIVQDPGLKDYIEENFGGVDECRKEILTDFFKHGFDGSGADNFFDAGSCIDGRLTSAWNWCSKIEKKRYYHVFKLAGFSGFDGEFQK
uniref:Predicted protein n=1 Tax=Hordeum vulgare subsp. vulgare TaxID=112509 RepID=F2E0E1_HORVV|nr:predicted protein [Hordeum vulgare subsp. vulgare]